MPFGGEKIKKFLANFLRCHSCHYVIMRVLCTILVSSFALVWCAISQIAHKFTVFLVTLSKFHSFLSLLTVTYITISEISTSYLAVGVRTALCVDSC